MLDWDVRSFNFFRFLLLLAFALPGLTYGQTSGSASATVTGLVTNKTNNKPAAGDTVVLLKLAQGMQELSTTKTDAKGHFALKIPADEAGSMHLVRVTHDRANYFEPVPPGTESVAVGVYTAAAELAGVSVSEDVMQIQTTPDGNSLRVVEHYLLRNDSQPQKTLFSDHPFEVYLPAGAKIDGASAKAPGGMGVEQPLVPMGDPDHYAIIFPIRPGETEFNIWYRMAYKTSATFQPRPVMATDALGIMMPKSMNFKPGPGTDYTSVSDQVGGKAQAFLARSVKPSQPLAFTVSGSGELPRDSVAQSQGGGAAGGEQAGASPGGPNASADPNTDTRPGGGLGTPLDKDVERDPWTKYRWWILLGLVLLLAVAAGLTLRSPGAVPASANASGTPADPLQVLRDEMFALETDRLEGRLTESQYGELKAAYDLVLKRALARTGSKPGESDHGASATT